MTDKPFHIVSTVGDPEDPKSWSGTPKALVDAFRKRIPSLKTHNVTYQPASRRIYQVANTLMGLGFRQSYRVGFEHWKQNRLAEDLLAELGPGDFFHIGSAHMPLSKKLPGQRHFYFTDYTVDLMHRYAPYRHKFSARYKKVTLNYERRLLEQVDGIFTTAWYVRDSLIDGGVPKEKVIAVGTGLGRVTGLEGDTKDYRNGYLLFVAKRGFHVKGGHLLLDALDIAAKKRPDLRLVLIGNDDDPESKDVLDRMKKHPNIEYHNWDTPDYKKLVRTAALYAGPALNEPWGLIYLEALVCETPVLGLERNALAQFTDNGKSGFLIKEATPDAVAAGILDAMSDPDRLERMGKAGRDYVLQTFTWDNAVEKMLHFMHS